MRQLTTSLQIAAITLLLLISSCKKPAKEEKKDEGPGTLLYIGNCGVSDQIFWLNNETILIGNSCEGSFKKVNVTTKAVQNITHNKDHLPQQIIFTEKVPDVFFYLAITINSSGSFSRPVKLFSYNLSTGTTATVIDSLPGIASRLFTSP
ncbi:MAG: hypothetical protein ICV51_22130 [Flavisolibacter sp.]|nr:hypothetical protein [Flavisolibacter sp.]